MWGSLMALRPWVEGKLQLAHGDLLGYKPPFPHFPRAPTRGGQAEAESWPAFVMWSTQMNLSEPEQGSDRICSSQQKIPEQKAKTLPTFPFFFFFRSRDTCFDGEQQFPLQPFLFLYWPFLHFSSHLPSFLRSVWHSLCS